MNNQNNVKVLLVLGSLLVSSALCVDSEAPHREKRTHAPKKHAAHVKETAQTPAIVTTAPTNVVAAPVQKVTSTNVNAKCSFASLPTDASHFLQASAQKARSMAQALVLIAKRNPKKIVAAVAAIAALAALDARYGHDADAWNQLSDEAKALLAQVTNAFANKSTALVQYVAPNVAPKQPTCPPFTYTCNANDAPTALVPYVNPTDVTYPTCTSVPLQCTDRPHLTLGELVRPLADVLSHGTTITKNELARLVNSSKPYFQSTPIHFDNPLQFGTATKLAPGEIVIPRSAFETASSFVSVGHTPVMGNTADLADADRTLVDTVADKVFAPLTSFWHALKVAAQQDQCPVSFNKATGQFNFSDKGDCSFLAQNLNDDPEFLG